MGKTRQALARPPRVLPASPVDGARVKELRHARGWTQRELAERWGVQQDRISKVENSGGKYHLLDASLDTLATVLGTSTDYLMRRTDVREPYPAPARLAARSYKERK